MNFTKESLKERLVKMDLDEDFQKALFGIIDQAREVNEALLDLVTELLETQADFEQDEDNILDQQEAVNVKLSEEIELLRQEFSKQER
jgi:hypothetical protein